MAKAFQPLLSHESPTGYDPPKLLLLSDHFVVEGLLCGRGAEQARGLTRCSHLAKDKQIYNNAHVQLSGLFINFMIRKTT